MRLLNTRIQGAGDQAINVANSPLDFDAKEKAIKTRIEFFNKNYVRAKGLAKQEKALKGRLSTIGANVEVGTLTDRRTDAETRRRARSVRTGPGRLSLLRSRARRLRNPKSWGSLKPSGQSVDSEP